MRSPKWFDYDAKEDWARELWALSDSLWNDDASERRQFAQDALTLYHANLRHDFLGAGDTGSILEYEPPSYNIIQACTDTMTAHVSHNRVRPMFITEGGDADLQEKALGMQRATDAIITESGFYDEEGSLFCRDGFLFDAGACKVTVNYAQKKVLVERIFAHELLVPPHEARLGRPRQMGHQMLIDRDYLLGFYEDDEDAQEIIKEADRASQDMMDSGMIVGIQSSDMVMVREWWHLPSGRVDRDDPKSFGMGKDGELKPDVDPGHDGRQAIIMDGKELSSAPWPFDYFPVILFRPRRNAYGMWSRGLAESLAPAQMTLRKFAARTDGILHLHAIPRLVLWKKAKIQKSKIRNDWADILESDVPPAQAMQLITPQSIPADLLGRQSNIIQQGEKQEGISELSIAATRPAGIDHAPPMQYLADTESIRHTPEYRAWENAFVHIARAVVDGIRMLAERDPDYELVFEDSKQLRRINWKKTDLGENMYHLKSPPTNLLPTTPAAKISRILDLVKEGLFTPEQGLAAVFDNPDVEALLGDVVSERKNIEAKIQYARQGDALKAQAHPWLNLEQAKQIARQTINRMELDGESDEAMEGVRKFWFACDELIKKAQAPAQGAPAGPPPGAPGPGGPPPGPPNLSAQGAPPNGA